MLVWQALCTVSHVPSSKYSLQKTAIFTQVFLYTTSALTSALPIEAQPQETHGIQGQNLVYVQAKCVAPFSQCLACPMVPLPLLATFLCWVSCVTAECIYLHESLRGQAHTIIFLRMSEDGGAIGCCHLIVAAITTFIRAAVTTHKGPSRYDLLTFSH